MSAPAFGAVVLAAGLARRMQGPNKLLLDLHGRPLVTYAIDAALASHATRVVLVTGRDGDTVAAAAPANAKLSRTHNDTPETGLARSLQLGLAALPDADAVAVVLGDMPNITHAIIDALFAAWTPAHYAAVPEHAGEIGNPVVLSRRAIADCATLTGDRGARKLIEAHANEIARVPFETRAIFADIDEAKDL